MDDLDLIRRAIHDPGSTPAGRRKGPSWGEGNAGYQIEQETVWDWVTRAVMPVVAEQIAEARAAERQRIAKWLSTSRLQAHGMPAGLLLAIGWIAGRVAKGEIPDQPVCIRCHERTAVHLLSGLCEPCTVSGGRAAGPGWDSIQPRLPAGTCGCFPSEPRQP